MCFITLTIQGRRQGQALKGVPPFVKFQYGKLLFVHLYVITNLLGVCHSGVKLCI